MKLNNNKGFTLIELIVSIALISIIMVFMFSLLSDVTFEKDNEYFASRNQEMRMEIINIVSKAARYNYQNNYTNPLKIIKFNNSKITTSETKYSSSSDTPVTISFGDNAKMHTLTVDKRENQIRFLSADAKKYAWTLKQGYIDSTSCQNKVSGQTVLVECIIKIFTANDNNNNINTENSAGRRITIDNNNSLDDIILDFMYKP